MNFVDILALRPAANDSASLIDAIAKAEDARIQALDQASHLNAEMARTLLTADDATMEAAEREAATARRASDRIEALIGQMKPMLAEAQEREAADGVQRLVESAIAADEIFVATFRKLFPSLVEKAALILTAKRHADEAIALVSSMGNGLPRYKAFPQIERGIADPLQLVLAVAEVAPSEIERRQAALNAETARVDEKRQREKQARLSLEIEGRERMRLESEMQEEVRLAKIMPLGIERAHVLINGQGQRQSSGRNW